MKIRFVSIIAASALTLGVSWAKARPAADEGREGLQDVERTVHEIRNQAGDLEAMVRDAHRLQESPVQALMTVRDEINSVGKELRALESERASLSPWERQTLDQIEPLMADAARNQTMAIEFYNADHRVWPLPAEFSGYVEKVRSDAGQVNNLISEHIKLAKARETENKLKQALGPNAD